MKTDIRDLLPEDLSDESAYHLITFFMNLAVELESCCYAQASRHCNDMAAPILPDYLINDTDDEVPF